MHRSHYDIDTGLYGIVFDLIERNYYNKRTDIFLEYEDIQALRLRPLTRIDHSGVIFTPGYFTDAGAWKESENL